MCAACKHGQAGTDTEAPAIEIYASRDGKVQLDVRLEQDTIWLTQAQIATLFGVKPQNITLHLRNIYQQRELRPAASCKDFLQAQQEGRRTVKRQRKHYNLDAIIAVGYRVNSARATQFRIWATETLRQHLTAGYTLHQQRLTVRGLSFNRPWTCWPAH